MVLLEIPRDAAVLVSPGGRLRVLQPRDTPLPANRKLMSLDDQRGYVYLPGYKVTHDIPPTSSFPYLLARGYLDGTNWEELHEDLTKVETRAKNAADRRRRLSSYTGIDVVEYFLKEPQHGGFFWALCRGVDGRVTVRTDTLGQHPLLYHRVSHAEFSEASREKQRNMDEPVEGESACDWLIAPAPAPHSDWPHITNGWKQHHPRHIVRINTQTCALDPVGGVTRFEELETARSADEKKQIEDARRFDLPAPDFTKPFTKTDAKGEPIPDPFANDGLLPLVPPSLYVPPSHVLDFPADPDLPPELQKKPPAGLPARLTEDGTERDNEGILEQSVELSKRLLASAKHVGVFLNLFRRGGSEKRKVGVLFSGGIDAVAVLVALRAWGVPCVAAVAGFTGGVDYPPDVTAARIACREIGVRLLVREVASVTEVTEALSRICKACVHLDVAKAKSSLSTYFACQALEGDNVLAVLSGTGADGLLNGIEHDIDGVRVSPNDELTLELSSLRNAFHASLQKDHAVCFMHGLECFHPFLSAFVAQFALDVPGRMKRLSTPTFEGTSSSKKKNHTPPLRKRILRVALERHPFCCTRELTRRAPLSPELGSLFLDALVQVATSLGFRDQSETSLAEAVAACAHLTSDEISKKAVSERKPEVFHYEGTRKKKTAEETAATGRINPPPPPPQFALLYTSGRNSTCAFHLCETRLRRRCAAVVPFSAPESVRCENFKNGKRHGHDSLDVDGTINNDPDATHTVTLRAAAAAFADAVGLPLWNRGVPGYTGRTRFAKTQKQTVTLLSKSLQLLRADYGILGVVHGHVFDVAALCAVEEACEMAGLIALGPVWGDSESLQKMVADTSGAAGVLVVAGSVGSVGSVIRDAYGIDTLIDLAGGPFAADGDACGVTFDAIPSEAVFYDDKAVVWSDPAGKGLITNATGNVGAREICWNHVSVVRRPAPPKLVRDVGGRGWVG